MENKEKTPVNTAQNSDLSHVQIEQLIQNNLELSETNSKLTDSVFQLELSLETALHKIQWYEEQIKLGKQKQFGKSSESLSKIQEEIIFNADEDTTSVASAQETESTDSSETITYTRRKSVGRKIDISQLLHFQELHDLSEEEKVCKCCGGTLHKIREEISKQVEEIPHQMYVIEHIHPQYGCRHCETVQSAEKEPSVIPKSMAGASLIASVILSKYEHHLPLYRQSKIWKGLGVDIPDNTLGNWVMQAGEGLKPIETALRKVIQSMNYLQVDETPVKVLKPEKKGYLWAYLSPIENQKLIWFRFDLTRSGKVVEEDLRDFKGLLQTDGYSGYQKTRERTDIISSGCIGHSRRKFIEVVQISSKKVTGKANEALKYFTDLYEIENEARNQKLNYETRKLLRQNKALPIVEKFHEWLLKSKNQVPPESMIGKAIDYTLKQWPHLIRYLDYGELEIDNNWVENQIRPFALGRRNWLFVGNPASAQVGALFYSLIQSAKMNNLNPRIYLHYLLTQVHALRKNEVNPQDLLPHRIDLEKLKQFAEMQFKKTQAFFATTKH
ncbi:MAG: IS66 family transposase [Bacteroidia bacterium]|jgi:transposase